MAQQQIITAIRRIEHALSRLEQASKRVVPNTDDGGLPARHERLKAETAAAISQIDAILTGRAG